MSVQAWHWVLEHEHTTKGNERLVLLALANHAGTSPVDGAWESWPGIDRIAFEANIERRQTVKDALGRLVERGLITRSVNSAPDGRIRPDRRPNLYRILAFGGDTETVPPPSSREHDSRLNGGTESEPTGARNPSHEPSVEPSVEPTTLLHTSDAIEMPDFEVFWKVWPGRGSKAEAKRVWPAAIKAAGSAQVIIDGAARYAADPNLPPIKYIPHGARWLKGERWNDGPEPSATGRDNGKPKSAIRMPIIEDRTPSAGPLTDEDLYGQR